MTSRLVLVLALAGCVESVPTVEVETNALMTVGLVPPDDHIPEAFGHYRWELVEKPAAAHEISPIDISPSISVTPLTRGIYVYDRFFVGEAGEQLTHHVVVTVHGVAPLAIIDPVAPVMVGTAATIDGHLSRSAELRPLTFRWRLAVRPPTSMTALSDAEQKTLMFTPDVSGDYGIELRVFDGELWSTPAMTTLTAR